MASSITKDYSQINSISVSNVDSSVVVSYVISGFTTSPNAASVAFARYGGVQKYSSYSGTITLSSGSLTIGKRYYAAVGRNNYNADYVPGSSSTTAGSFYAYALYGYYTGGTTITFDANGGSGAPSSVTTYWALSSTMNTFHLNAIPSTIPTRSGYIFLGWATSSTATTAKYTAGQTNPTVGKTLYAVWEENTSYSYTLTYNANGGSGAPSAQSSGTVSTTSYTFTVSSTKPTWTGHTFKGWGSYSTSTVVSWNSGDSLTVTADKTIYAVWATTYKVYYNANGGSGAPSTQSATSNARTYTFTLSSTEPTRSGYKFLGWATTSTATTAEYQPGDSYALTRTAYSKTLYAVWEENETASILVKVNGAWKSGGVKVKVGGVWKDASAVYVKVNNVWKMAGQSPTPSSDYGTVYYKASSGATTTQEVEITSLSEFNSLVGTSDAILTNVVVNGVTLNATGTNVIVGLEIGSQITSIPDYFLKGCYYFNQPLTLPNDITTIGNAFLYGCSGFNQALTLSSGVTSIGDYFLFYCPSFNQPLTLPSGLTSIGSNFLYGCGAFNQALTLPSSVTSIGSQFINNCKSFNKTLTLSSNLTSIGSLFMYECDAMTSYVNVGPLPATILNTSNYAFSTANSEAVSYTVGIKIRGPNRAAWMTRFPNRTSSPYRKLVDYGS